MDPFRKDSMHASTTPGTIAYLCRNFVPGWNPDCTSADDWNIYHAGKQTCNLCTRLAHMDTISLFHVRLPLAIHVTFRIQPTGRHHYEVEYRQSRHLSAIEML